MHKTPFVRYTLTTLSALTLIPLTYSLISRPDAEVTQAGDHSAPAVHRPGSSQHSCSLCNEPLPAVRQAAQARKIAASGLLWEPSLADPSSAAPTMRIVQGMPQSNDYQVGSEQRLTLEDGTKLVFEVKNYSVHADGTVAVDAILPGSPQGQLHIQWNDKDDFFLGQIEYADLPLAYEMTRSNDGEHIITRRSIDQLVCAEVDTVTQKVTYGLPAVDQIMAAEADAPADDSIADDEGASLVPALNSYPSASAVIYLDFDGEVVKNTLWGTNIIATSPNYSAAKITDIWKRVAADMEAFNLNVTTEEAVFLNTASNRRIRCIITPSNEWYKTPTVGGVAKRSSFTWSGDTPCWAFSDNLLNGTKYIAECCAHEVGHTLGLAHDGKTGTSYYAGHGSGDVGWAPIMGNGYYKTLTQWSKGEYSSATNTQDDLSIITSNNGFGYRSDDHSDKKQGATILLADSADHVSGVGVIETRGDVDVFALESEAGSLSLDIAAEETITNLDIEATLYDDKGNLLVSVNPSTQLNASISITVEGGTYYLHVRATGYGTVNTGSSDYASLGAYAVSGDVAAAVVLTPYELTVASLPKNAQGLESDPDGDGLNNLVEHALGTDPAVANTTQGFTSLDFTENSGDGFDFLLDLPADIPSDALYTVEATCDLSATDWASIASRDAAGNWSGSAKVSEEVGPEGKHRFRITDSLGETWTCRFMRVRFEIVNPS